MHARHESRLSIHDRATRDTAVPVVRAQGHRDSRETPRRSAQSSRDTTTREGSDLRPTVRRQSETRTRRSGDRSQDPARPASAGRPGAGPRPAAAPRGTGGRLVKFRSVRTGHPKDEGKQPDPRSTISRARAPVSSCALCRMSVCRTAALTAHRASSITQKPAHPPNHHNIATSSKAHAQDHE